MEDYWIGSTKSLLIFGRNLRRGIPTLSTPKFPHRGYSEVLLSILQDTSSGVLEPSAQVLLGSSSGCILAFHRDGSSVSLLMLILSDSRNVSSSFFSLSFYFYIYFYPGIQVHRLASFFSFFRLSLPTIILFYTYQALSFYSIEILLYYSIL